MSKDDKGQDEFRSHGSAGSTPPLCPVVHRCGLEKAAIIKCIHIPYYSPSTMSQPTESRVDVLVIGAGPGGLICANALARAGIDVKIIDRRYKSFHASTSRALIETLIPHYHSPLGVPYGQADGIQSRSMEVLQSYGLAELILREAAQVHMSAFYNPGHDGGIKCTGRAPVSSDFSARYPFEVTLRHAMIESIFLDALKNNGVLVDCPRQPSAMEISENLDELSSTSSHPVKVTVEHFGAAEGDNKTEIIHAKFVVGADGAHSWVRKTLGIEMQGEQTDYIWGVLDMIIDTNFPEIRYRTAIHSTSGSAMIIPREGDLIRLYIQLSDKDVIDPSTGRVDKNRITPEDLISVSRKIFYPYVLSDPKEIKWWTIYTIGQRVASSFFSKDRVFIAGDACHTHSPKAGQGMNASMNDTHNLAWKLTHVLRRWANPSILRTYEHERRKYALDLINFDKELASLFSTKPQTEANEDGVSHERFFE
ncbi:FAD-binding monooxygenase [Chiua virens]|nr:FAD-binding monooxygenase [Chiua virens]